MYHRILVAVGDYEQAGSLLQLVKGVGTEGATEVRVLHCRLRELSGRKPFASAGESNEDASLVAEAAAFDLRMAGVGASIGIRYAFVDRVAEAICERR